MGDVALYPWRTGDPIPGTEGMMGHKSGCIRVGDPGPVSGTMFHGDCPVCDEVVYSSGADHDVGLREHIAIRHPDWALEHGIRKADPKHPGWDRVGAVDVPSTGGKGV